MCTMYYKEKTATVAVLIYSWSRQWQAKERRRRNSPVSLQLLLTFVANQSVKPDYKKHPLHMQLEGESSEYFAREKKGAGSTVLSTISIYMTIRKLYAFYPLKNQIIQ